MIQLSLDRQRYAPGEAVRGSVSVNQSVAARSLFVAIRCVEQTPDFTDAVTDIPPVALAQGDLLAGSGYAFALALPGDALPTLRSTHGRIRWEAIAWFDESGRDASTRAEFEVAIVRAS